uniref:C2H2-type domain-containing protein n=1 Tax=Panagrellus redivivus TaxID=6233 RepID=A0A7E4US11_PANRE
MAQPSMLEAHYEYYYENDLPPGAVIYEVAEDGTGLQGQELEGYEYIDGDLAMLPKYETDDAPLTEYYYQQDYEVAPDGNNQELYVGGGEEVSREQSEIASEYLDNIPTGDEESLDDPYNDGYGTHVDEIIEQVAHDVYDDMSPMEAKHEHERRPRKRGPTTRTCEYCGLHLKYPSKILAHMRTHTGERPFVCPFCEKTFSQRTPWRCHVRRHTGDTPFACHHCERSFPNASTRKAHEARVHFKEVPIPNRGYVETDVPVTYLHDNPPSPSYSPAIKREQQSTEVSSAVVDIVESVGSGDVPLSPELVDGPRGRMPMLEVCNICGLHLKYPSRIQQHMRSHIGWKPFTCGVCGLALSSTSTLKVHMRRLHSTERPFVCRWACGKRFPTRSHRNEHEKIVHSKIKRYQCAIGECFRLFTRRTYLIKHLTKDHSDLRLLPLSEKGFRVIAVPCGENMSAKVPDTFDTQTARVFKEADGKNYVVDVLGPMQEPSPKNAIHLEDRILDDLFIQHQHIVSQPPMDLASDEGDVPPMLKLEDGDSNCDEEGSYLAQDEEEPEQGELLVAKDEEDELEPHERQYANLLRV